MKLREKRKDAAFRVTKRYPAAARFLDGCRLRG
jgi:hypothetical protein